MDTNLSLNFWLWKSKKNAAGKAPIYLRITFNGSRSEISSGQFVAAKQWDNKRGQIKGSGEEAQVIN